MVKRIFFLIFIYLCYFIYHFYNQFYFDEGISMNQYFKNINSNKIYAETFFQKRVLFPKEFLLEYQFERCDIAQKYIITIINVSYTKDKILLEQYKKRLEKSFSVCNMIQQQLFFSQIDQNETIKLDKKLNEEEQIQNIINYYYLIEPNSLLSEMKRMNYQSRDALLIMEKLEIDIAWEMRYDFKGQDEHFNRLVNKSIS